MITTNNNPTFLENLWVVLGKVFTWLQGLAGTIMTTEQEKLAAKSVATEDSAPPTPDVPLNKEGIPVAKIAAAILQQNNQQLIFKLVPTFMEPLKGVTIHKISPTTATQLATIIDKASVNFNIPLSYILACMDIESTFDPQAVNENLLGSNKAHEEAGYDEGLCQFKLRYLVGENGIKTVDEANAFDLNPELAVPYFYREYEGLIQWAASIQPQLVGSAPNPKAHNLYWAATVAYNFGREGALKLILAGDDIPHGDKVCDLTTWFSKQFSVPNPMGDIAG